VLARFESFAKPNIRFTEVSGSATRSPKEILDQPPFSQREREKRLDLESEALAFGHQSLE
jgi:hypothetical protein